MALQGPLLNDCNVLSIAPPGTDTHEAIFFFSMTCADNGYLAP